MKRYFSSFKYKIDIFKVAYVNNWNNSMSTTDFQKGLEETINDCKKKSASSIFINIPQQNYDLIGKALEMGFDFHFVDVEGKGLTLLKKFRPANIPSQPSHHVGGSAMLISNDLRQVFLVKEKFGDLRHMWKLPGGKIEANESIQSGISRELFEETGLKGDFLGLIAMSEAFPSLYRFSNLYFLGLMIAQNYESTIDSEELQDGKWFDFDQYLSFDYPHEFYRQKIAIIKRIMQCKNVDEIRNLTPFSSNAFEIAEKSDCKGIFHSPKSVK